MSCFDVLAVFVGSATTPLSKQLFKTIISTFNLYVEEIQVKNADL
jgi:hypothetical protein